MTPPDFTWEPTPPSDVGIKPDVLEAMQEGLQARRTKAVLVVRHDRVAWEWYAPDHGPTQPHYTASLAKALVGGMALLVALEDGFIDADDPACTYIPAWQDHPQRSRITIRHLATHSSGIADANVPGKTHDELTGWMGAFWRRDPDPFSIALDRAPLLFAPGTGYLYNNPGTAALAYVITAALKGAPQSDIRSLLKDRVMDPIGVAEDEWAIGYGRPYEVDGLTLYATWGGGSYTARAAARVGRLMLRKGDWDGRRLLDRASIDRVTCHAGTPLPPRPLGNPQPGSGLCWWTNFDGVWPAVPRDAFAGAGAGNQVLLVVPSLDLIVVRNGGLLGDDSNGEGFWGGLERYLFNPLMDAVV